MNILTDNILTLNLVFSTLVFWAAARLYLMPKLDSLGARAVLIPILLLHSTRHLGLMFLAAGATYAGMPTQFAYPAAFGDLLAAILAFVSLWAVVRGSRRSRLLVTTFNVEGSIDLVAAIALAAVYEVDTYMGAAYWIPALWVPALLVTHYITFVLLRRHWPARKTQIPGPTADAAAMGPSVAHVESARTR